MSNFWKENICYINRLIDENKGPDALVVVTGSEMDSSFWIERLQATCSEIMNKDHKIPIYAVTEKKSLGNFIGTLNAVDQLKSSMNCNGNGIYLMSMLFGKGTRLSPFTQALGNRKIAFPVPRKSDNIGKYFTICELSNYAVNQIVALFRDCGFNGIVILQRTATVVVN